VQAVSLIRRSRDFRTLLLSRVVSELGTWFAYVGLTVAVFERTGSPVWVSVLLLLDILPSIALGILVAPLLDRWVRKYVLVAVELVGAAVFVALVFADSLAGLLALAAVAGIGGSILRPGIRAAVPSLVDEDDLPRANSLVRSAGAVAILAGPPVAGLLVAAGGTDTVFLLNAWSFVFSAATLARIPRGRLQTTRSLARKLTFDGFTLFRTPALKSVLVSWCVANFGWTLTNVTEVFLARGVFHKGAAGFGLLAAFTGAGLLVGSLAAGSLARRGSLPRLYRNALLLGAGGLIVAATAHWFALALVAAAVATSGNALALGFADLNLQRNVPSDRLGQAFGVFQSCLSAAGVTGMVCAGAVAGLVGTRAAWAVASALLVVAAAVATVLAREPVSSPAPAATR
jgi:MFS family permease